MVTLHVQLNKLKKKAGAHFVFQMDTIKEADDIPQTIFSSGNENILIQGAAEYSLGIGQEKP